MFRNYSAKKPHDFQTVMMSPVSIQSKSRSMKVHHLMTNRSMEGSLTFQIKHNAALSQQTLARVISDHNINTRHLSGNKIRWKEHPPAKDPLFQTECPTNNEKSQYMIRTITDFVNP